jgi:diguanylate cyclase (GGDEF)-like protein
MNQSLLERILRSPRLPSLPTIAIEVIELVQQRDVNIRQIAQTISHDPALSSKILRTVNSSFYGLSQPVSTVTHALVILGLSSVKTLALGFSLVGKLRDSSAVGFDHNAFWRRSLFTAVAARSLAKEAGLIYQEEAFLGGLLEDLGMLALSQVLGAEYTTLLQEVGPSHQLIMRACRQRYKTDHAEVGGALAQHWHLPPILVAPIRFHEDPEGGPEELMPMIRCVALGNRAADIFLTKDATAALDTYYRLAHSWFNLTRERAEPLLQSVRKDAEEMKRLIDLPGGGGFEDSEAILARASDALVQLSLQQQRTSHELEEQNRRLAEQALTDSLTGAANRRHFNQFIADQFAAAGNSKAPLSLLFMDVDHFKHFNDTYGHQTGDRVLAELASAIRAGTPKEGLLARYGGEEFAVVLPGTDRAGAAAAAEHIRQLVQAIRVEGEQGEKLSITISIGVAAHDGMFFSSVEQLIRAADQGVYAAKSAGRNCVRVFAPRPKLPVAA